MLPPMPQLMPPLLFNHLALVNLVDRPEVPVALVEEYRLEYMLVVRYGCLVRAVVHAELVLIVAAVEGHFDLFGVFGV